MLMLSDLVSNAQLVRIMAHASKKYSSGFFEECPVKKPLDENEVVIIDDDSDDDNNNAESSPDRHQAADHSLRDSDETERRGDSTSSDEVSVSIVEARPTKELDEIEELSRISSSGKLFKFGNC